MEKTLNPRGVRFAPSPTGRLHIGNLRTAWVSHEWARAWGEPWVVRFEDIDEPRSVPGAREQQLEDMARLGLKPDVVVIQSLLRVRHWETFARAIAERRVYPCACSRKEVREALDRAGSAPHLSIGAGTPVVPTATYSGHCRGLQAPPDAAEQGLSTLAWRFAVEEDPSGRSDFIIARSGTGISEGGLPRNPESFAPAYHWACSVDDLDGHYRLLVRAADLLEVVPSHRAIMKWLAGSEKRMPAMWPAVFHAALVTQNDGHRLEKRTRGATLTELEAAGLGIPEILKAFGRSVALPEQVGQWEPGKIFGEERQTMTLQQLGLG